MRSYRMEDGRDRPLVLIMYATSTSLDRIWQLLNKLHHGVVEKDLPFDGDKRVALTPKCQSIIADHSVV